MAKDKLTDYDATAGNNTDIGGISVDEGMLPSNVNNAIREIMSHLKDFAAGTQGVTTIGVDTINETTADGGVTVDGLLIKDKEIGTSAAPATLQASAINGGQIGGRRNLIINGAMQVAQRGTSFGTLSAQAYTLDRWNVDAGATVQQASLAIDEISNDTKLTKAIQMQGASSDYFRTRLEDVTNFSNQTLTLSFYVKGSSATTLNNIYARQNFGSGGSALVDTAFSNISFSVTTSFTRYTATVTLPSISGKTVGTSSFLEIYMQLPDGVTVYLTGVQLEVGSVATEFEHRSFPEELALCQRYFSYNCAGTGKATSTTVIQAQLPTIVTMRASPSIAVVNGTGAAGDIGISARNLTGVSGTVDSQLNGVSVQLTCSTTNNGNIHEVYANRISFDAEL